MIIDQLAHTICDQEGCEFIPQITGEDEGMEACEKHLTIRQIKK